MKNCFLFHAQGSDFFPLYRCVLTVLSIVCDVLSIHLCVTNETSTISDVFSDVIHVVATLKKDR